MKKDSFRLLVEFLQQSSDNKKIKNQMKLSDYLVRHVCLNEVSSVSVEKGLFNNA